MAPTRDRGRLGAVSATLSAGTLMFIAMGATPASAATGRSSATGDCLPLLQPVCDILGAGGSTSSSPPPSSSGGGGGTASKPSSAPKPKPKPKPAAKPPARAHHASRGSGSVPLPSGDVPTVPVPQTAQAPALPDVTDQDPLVMPEAGPGAESPPARLVADSAPDGETIPPLLVATASGLIGAVAALNLSVLRHRRQD
jgi:hypothetical protein